MILDSVGFGPAVLDPKKEPVTTFTVLLSEVTDLNETSSLSSEIREGSSSSERRSWKKFMVKSVGELIFCVEKLVGSTTG